MRGISMSSRMMSGSSPAAATRVHAVLGGQHAHAVALEQPLRHAAHRDRVVDDQRERAPVALIEHRRFGGRARHSERTSDPCRE
jgi:hypothetical protein